MLIILISCLCLGGNLIYDFRGPQKDYILSELERRKTELRTQLVWIGAQKEPGYTSRTWKWVNGTHPIFSMTLTDFSILINYKRRQRRKIKITKFIAIYNSCKSMYVEVILTVRHCTYGVIKLIKLKSNMVEKCLGSKTENK